VVLVLLLMSAVLVACGGSSGPDSSADSDPTATATASAADSADCPVRNHLAADFNGQTRTGLQPPVDYAFIEAQKGGCLPVRFNPCEPIHYVLNTALAPPGALDDLTQAMAVVAAATGITFVNDGPTDEPTAVNRLISQPQRYGNRWAPVLITWDHGAPFRMERTNPAGGRSFPVDGVSVSGVLIVNIDAVSEASGGPPASGFGDGATWGRVFIHELGHLIGLGHVARSDEIMFTELGVQRGRAEFHAGDLAGLRLLGKDAGCVPTPSAPSPPARK
jgi:hypothetical protein